MILNQTEKGCVKKSRKDNIILIADKILGMFFVMAPPILLLIGGINTSISIIIRSDNRNRK
jgi:hypothetical protein